MKGSKDVLRFISLAVEHKIVLPVLLLIKKACGNKGPLKVNIGGGYFCRRGWINLDYITPNYPYYSKYIDKNFNLMSGEPLPFEDESVKLFYSSNSFERIFQEDMEFHLKEMRRCLVSGGVARIIVPDSETSYNAYAGGDAEYLKKHSSAAEGPERALIERFATELCGKIDPEDVRRRFDSMDMESFMDYYTNQLSRDHQLKNTHNHVNWLTCAKLGRMLKDAGFSEIINSEPGQSRVPELRSGGGGLGCFFNLHNLNGFDKMGRPDSLLMEAVKK